MIDPLRFEHVERIDSTNAELMRRPFGACPQSPVALLADVQEVGRGRNGRPWLSDGSQSLTVSVAIERHQGGESLLGLPLAVGVTIAEVLDRHGANTRLKWPNDLYLDGPQGLAKAGGILVEVRQFAQVQRIVIGCGLNLSASALITSAQAGQAVRALFDGREAPSRMALAQTLAHELVASMNVFSAQGLAPFLGRWRSRDLLAGRPVDVLRTDGRRDPGTARGVDESGALVVEFADGRIEHCVGGEISVRAR